MACTLLQGLTSENVKMEAVLCLSSSRSLGQAKARLAHYSWPFEVSDQLDDFLAGQPNLIVEAAGQEAVRLYGRKILAAGISLGIASVGALTDDKLHNELLEAARSSGAKLHIVPGAVGGVDILSAARLSGLQEVTYTSRKPPSAWRGTKAESHVKLEDLQTPFPFFRGSAREAAASFPQNANVAATIALAGIGFEKTKVQLVADPTIGGNIHELHFVSGCAETTLRIEGKPSPDNPKTSQTAGFSLARFVLNQMNQEAV